MGILIGPIKSVRPFTISILPAQPSIISVLPAQLSTISILPAQPSIISILPAQPSTISVPSAQPSIISVPSAQPSIISVLPAQPSIISAPSTQPSIISALSQRRSQSRHERRKERMQACTIGLSIDEDIKLRRRRRSWNGHVYVHALRRKRTPDQVTRTSAVTRIALTGAGIS